MEGHERFTVSGSFFSPCFLALMFIAAGWYEASDWRLDFRLPFVAELTWAQGSSQPVRK